MKTINRNILNLQKSLSEDKNSLSFHYKNFGKKLLSDTSAPEKNTETVDQKTASEYRKLIEERNLCTKNILEIKSATDRLEELSKFKKQILKNQKEIENTSAEMQRKSALMLYSDFKNEKLACFEDCSTAEFETEITAMQEAINTLNKEKSEANVLGKLDINRKIAGNKLKISSIKKKLEKRLSKNAEAIFSCADVKFLYESDRFSAEMKSLYEKVLQLKTSKTDILQHLANLSEEQNFLTEKLLELKALESAAKKTSELNSRMHEIDLKTDAILEKCGTAYADSVLDGEGNFLAGESFNFKSLPENYGDYIGEISVLRCRIAKTNYNIEYCKTDLQKEAIEAKIESLYKAIESYNFSIKNFQERIASAENDIKLNEKEKKKIEERLELLFAKFNVENPNRSEEKQ